MEAVASGYKVWALDDVVYGPVEPAVLREWVRDERIRPDTWIFCVRKQRWSPAAELPELSELFGEPEAANPSALVRPAVLRRIRVLAELNDEQLGHFARIGQVVTYPAFSQIMKLGMAGDSMFMVLDGQVRLRLLVKEREILISVQEAGGVFGQISLFDGGPRITDAVSDSPVTLFKIVASSFRLLCRQHPDIATSILFALGRTLATRIRTDDKHLCEMVSLHQAES